MAARSCASCPIPRQERPHGGDRVERQTPVRQGLLGDDDDGHLAQASAPRERSQIRSDLLLRALGDTVEDDGDAKAALGRLLQVPPRDRVRVASRGRDKNPQISAVEKLRGEPTIPLLDRIDVGGIQDADRRPHHVVYRHRHGVQARARPALVLRQARQHAIRHEPRAGLRRTHENRPPRRRTNSARPTHRTIKQRVDER